MWGMTNIVTPDFIENFVDELERSFSGTWPDNEPQKEVLVDEIANLELEYDSINDDLVNALADFVVDEWFFESDRTARPFILKNFGPDITDWEFDDEFKYWSEQMEIAVEDALESLAERF